MDATFAIYASETAQKPLQGCISTLRNAIEIADRNYRTFVIRRSTVYNDRIYPRGMIVHTQRFPK